MNMVREFEETPQEDALPGRAVRGRVSGEEGFSLRAVSPISATSTSTKEGNEDEATL